MADTNQTIQDWKSSIEKDLYIFGSSGYARETYCVIKSLNQYNVCAFVDIHSGKDIAVGNEYISVISEDAFEEMLHNTDEKVNAVISIADARIAQKIHKRFRNKCIFPNIVSPLSLFYESMQMGEGNIIAPYCIFTVNVKVGSFNKFNIGVTVAHDVNIGDFNQFNPFVDLSGNVSIGSGNLLGIKSTVLQGLNIGDNNTLGASALLTKSISSEREKVYVGVPARKVDL